MICDVCGRDVPRLKAKATGSWGLDLCPPCHGRLLVQRRRGTLSIPALVEAALAAGGPPEWPLCEWCGDDIDAHGLGYYTTERTRRRFCSFECRQIHNSRVSANQRAATMRDRVRRGLCRAPYTYLTPEQLSDSGRRAAAIYAARVHAEMEAGTWQPYRLPPERRRRPPRKHRDNPDLHHAFQKIRAGARIADLSPAEREAFRLHRRQLAAQKRQARNDRQQEARRARLADPESRATLRTGEARRRARVAARPPNGALAAAREAAGFTIQSFADTLGIRPRTVNHWERHSAIPRDPALRQRVADLLGVWPWPVPDPALPAAG